MMGDTDNSQSARERLSDVPPDLQERFRKALDEADKKAVAASARPAIELALRLLETLNSRDAASALEQSQRDFPADLQVRRWQVIVQALARLSLTSLRQIWDSDQLQRAMRRAGHGHFEEAKILLDAIATEQALDLTPLLQDMELAALLKRAEIGWLKLQAARDLPGRGREARQAAGDLLAILDESDRYLKSRTDHSYLEYVAAAWPQRSLWRSAARAVVDEPDIATDDPGDEIAGARDLILQNAPDAAVAKLDILLQSATIPEQTAKILPQLKLARAVRYFQAFLAQLNWAAHPAATEGEAEAPLVYETAAVLRAEREMPDALRRMVLDEHLGVLIGEKSEIRGLFADAIDKRIRAAIGLRSLASTLRLVAAEKLLLLEQAPDRTNEILELTRSLSQEQLERNRRLKRHINRLRALRSKKSLTLAQGLCRACQGMDLSEEQAPTFSEMYAEIQVELETLERDEKFKGLRDQAQSAEKQGDQLIDGLAQKDLEKAIEHYRSAERLWRGEIGNVKEADRLTEKCKETAGVQRDFRSIFERLKVVDDRQKLLNDLHQAGIRAEAKRSAAMTELCTHLAELRFAFRWIDPLPAAVRTRVDLALVAARKAGWADEEFWAQVDPLPQNWAEKTLCGEFPPKADAAWLMRTRAALIALRATGKQLGDMTAPLILGLEAREEACQALVEAHNRRDQAAAVAALPKLVEAHEVVYWLRASEITESAIDPSKTPIQNPPARGVQTTAWLAWLDTCSPDTVAHDLAEVILREEKPFVPEPVSELAPVLPSGTAPATGLEPEPSPEPVPTAEPSPTEAAAQPDQPLVSAPAVDLRPPKPPRRWLIPAGAAAVIMAAVLSVSFFKWPLSWAHLIPAPAERTATFTPPPTSNGQPVDGTRGTEPALQSTKTSQPTAAATPIAAATVEWTPATIQVPADYGTPVPIVVTLKDYSGKLLPANNIVGKFEPSSFGAGTVITTTATVVQEGKLETSFKPGTQAGNHEITLSVNGKEAGKLPITILEIPVLTLEVVGKDAPVDIEQSMTYTVSLTGKTSPDFGPLNIECQTAEGVKVVRSSDGGAIAEDSRTVRWEGNLGETGKWQATFEVQANAVGEYEGPTCAASDRWGLPRSASKPLPDMVVSEVKWTIDLQVSPQPLILGDGNPVTVTAQISNLIGNVSQPVSGQSVSFSVTPPQVGLFVSDKTSARTDDTGRALAILKVLSTTTQTLTITLTIRTGYSEQSLDVRAIAVTGTPTISNLAFRTGSNDNDPPNTSRPQLNQDDSLRVLGRRADSMRLFVENTRNGEPLRGWVSAQYVKLSDDITVTQLPISP